nr:immunoglobulin heavy chain junction region [Macaca mulatta]MOW78975.1 immunoglobulin heavy chain junction region [Macaca mulatta]MOW80780.1 immunoglobulin heavy chain junction region [Macaca mulatta]MOW82590.1 immunoglobulin heavy chain junction region [Macaca mulatta]MOW86405.1 immunoglobulin heavy chain junction region [Macaca mulatta]
CARDVYGRGLDFW